MKFDSSILFLNRGGFNPGEQKLPVFSDTEEVQEGFSLLAGITSGRAGQRGFMLSIFLLQH
ncbi:hypothetical protein [Paraburkholderia sp. 40]|uniref:hypothetical protein n=1 Tax=Paraburkholderia sp. 40 TaxID=2991059 RepID=UPI003D1BCDE5